MKKKIDSLTQLRQIELVEQYYDLDEETKTVQLVLTYKKASDILAKDIGKLKHPLIRQEIIQRIKDIIETFPDGYSVNLQLVIEDYEGYDPTVLLESFNDKLEFNSYGARSDDKKGWFQALLLILAGLILLVFNIHAKNYNWYESGLTSQAYGMIFDSFASLLIWEAGTVIFLSPSDYKAITKTFLKRIKTISFLKPSNEILASESGDDILQNWVQGTKAMQAGRTLLIGCSFLFSVQALSSFSTALQTLMDNPLPWERSMTIVVIGQVLGFIWDVLSIIAGFEYYMEKGKLRKALPFFAIVSFVMSFTLLIISFFQLKNASTSILSSMIRYFLGLFASLGYGVGYFLCAATSKRKKK